MSGAGELAMAVGVATSRGRAPVRVCLVGPSLDILGGQAVQLQRLLSKLREVPELEVDFGRRALSDCAVNRKDKQER